MSEHTPTPWKVTRYTSDHLTIFVDRPDLSSGHPVHELVADVHDDTGNAKANAAFIVRAVNAHEDLLTALREGIAALIAYQNQWGKKSKVMAEALQKMQDAIARAEEREA